MGEEGEIRLWIHDLRKHLSASLSASIPRQYEVDEVKICSLSLQIKNMYRVTKKMFSPQNVSIGPLHYLDSSLGGNPIKREALCRMMICGHHNFTDEVLERLVSVIMEVEPRITAAYVDPFPSEITGLKLANMIIEDSCFLLTVLAFVSMDDDDDSSPDPSNLISLWPELPTLMKKHGILADLLKFENQVPLWVLKLVADNIPGWQAKPYLEESTIQPLFRDGISCKINMGRVLEKLCPLSIDRSAIALRDVEVWRVSYMLLKGNLLSLLTQFMSQEVIIIESHDELYRVLVEVKHVQNNFYVKDAFLTRLMEKICSLQMRSHLFFRISYYPFLFLHYLSPIFSTKTLIHIHSWYRWFIFSFLGSVFMILGFLWPSISEEEESLEDNTRASVFGALYDIVPCKNGMKGISLRCDWAIFYQMRLPQIYINKETEAILQNVMALESFHPNLTQHHVASYVCLMTTLIHKSEDLKALKAAGVIRTSVGEADLLKMWESLNKNTSSISHSMAVADTSWKTRRKLYAHFREPSPGLKFLNRLMTGRHWFRMLIRTHASNPWIAVSTIAAISLLGMTAIQVVCLFSKCGAT